ncbi:MAG: class I SAM-dependent methyltransferase [Nitrospinaceae bacterium]
MSLKDKGKWDEKYREDPCPAGREPVAWLMANAFYLTGSGKALDLAMGEGRNAIYAAGLGYEVLGVDISEVGVAQARTLASQKNLSMETLVVDLDDWPLPEDSFDLVMCFYFLDRRLFAPIRRAVRPGGLVLFETFTGEHQKHSGLRREWTLEPNELLREFSGFRVLHYQEKDQEEKAVASIVARRETHA